MKQEREMKEDIRIQRQLRAYLQWPLFMAVILMAANVVVLSLIHISEPTRRS